MYTVRLFLVLLLALPAAWACSDDKSKNSEDLDSAGTDSTESPSSDSGHQPTTNTGSDDSVETAGCKRGATHHFKDQADITVLSQGVFWWYNWDYHPDSQGGYHAGEIDYLPMIWGESSLDDMDTVIDSIPEDAKVLLGFNEPNFYSQANLSAQRTAELWPLVEQIADAKGLTLVSPAVNFCGGGCHDTDPVSYLEDFFAACKDCRVDKIAIHIYVGCDANSDGLKDNRARWLIDKVEMYKKAFDKPLWLTEFACSGNPSVSDQKAFMIDAVEYLENEPRIERYFWFHSRADNMVNVDLLSASGELTELGETYVALPHNPLCSAN